MENLGRIWKFFKGKKTYIAGFAAIIYGVASGDKDMIFLGLGLLGLRHGLANEIRNMKEE